MELVAERFRPTRPDSREAMKRLQAEIATEATFEDAAGVTPTDVRSGDAVVAGVDQAFLGERAVSAVVVLRGGEVIARESAITPPLWPAQAGDGRAPGGRTRSDRG